MFKEPVDIEIMSPKQQMETLDKSLGMDKLLSEKLHRRAIYCTALGATGLATFFIEPAHQLYSKALGFVVNDVIPNTPAPNDAFDIVTMLGDYGLPVASGALLIYALYSQRSSTKQVLREGNYKANRIIKKGIIKKDKYLEKGASILRKIYPETYILTDEQMRDLTRHYAEVCCQDRRNERTRKLSTAMREQQHRYMQRKISDILNEPCEAKCEVVIPQTSKNNEPVIDYGYVGIDDEHIFFDEPYIKR